MSRPAKKRSQKRRPSSSGGNGVPMPAVIGLIAAAVAGGMYLSKNDALQSTSSPSQQVAAPQTGVADNRVTPRPPSVGSSDYGIPPTSAPPSARSTNGPGVSVKANVYGATVTVKTIDGQTVLASEVMGNDSQEIDVAVNHRTQVRVEVSLADETIIIDDVNPNVGGKVHAAEFSPSQMKSIQKAATCLIRMPGGGFGSGFLMNDRSTITTAAHCVAADNVGDLEFAFRPLESDEVTTSGAQLVFFDAGLDVAVLRLPEPMDDTWPFFVHASTPPEASTPVHAIGNPGRGGRPDPTFLRSGKIQGVGTDEFFLDFELKPGNSGGPVCEAETMVAHGIVSWKFLRKMSEELSYEELGRSFAKLTDLAGDAYENFISEDEAGRVRHMERLNDSFGEQRAMSLAQQAALGMAVDSIMYWMLCRDVAVNYIREINRVRGGQFSSLTMVRRAERAAHERFMAEDAPKYAERAREELTPRLRMTDSKVYEQALANENLPDDLKEKLRDCHATYEMLKAAAENIVHDDSAAARRRRRLEGESDRSKLGDGKNRTLEEFFEWTTDLTNDTIRTSESVLRKTGFAVE